MAWGVTGREKATWTALQQIARNYETSFKCHSSLTPCPAKGRSPERGRDKNYQSLFSPRFPHEFRLASFSSNLLSSHRYLIFFLLTRLGSRSNRLQSSYCAQVGARAKEKDSSFLLWSQLSRRTLSEALAGQATPHS